MGGLSMQVQTPTIGRCELPLKALQNTYINYTRNTGITKGTLVLILGRLPHQVQSKLTTTISQWQRHFTRFPPLFVHN